MVHLPKRSTIELIALCKEAQFSSNQLSAMLLLYRSVFFPRLISNCETWSTLTKPEVESLQKAKLRYLRNMMEVANSTPVAGTFLELGILAIQFDMRKLNFLWKILQKENDDLVKQIYVELKRNCFEKNWANKVIGLRSRYGLPICDEEVKCAGKTEWCKKVKGAIYRSALNELNTACKVSSKTNMLPFHSNLKCQGHITSLHPKLSRLLFKAKLGMFDIKCNFKNKYRNNLLSPVCSVTDENL